MESLQGEGGIHPATPEFMQGIRKLCDEKGILLILDEIQCGMGRTGKLFAFEHYGIKPDILTSAKALGCGVPVGAFAATEEVADTMVPGDHGTTYGGNPLATAAVCKVFEIFQKEKILEHVEELTPYLRGQLETLQQEFDVVRDVRGIGFMQGIELSIPAAPIVSAALEKGLVLISAGTNIIRVVPPLVAQKEHIDEMCGILREVLV
jgi:acetylornithine/N-succinyldiaminopimelate aminotransferase